MKLRREKCEFAKKELEFLGHIVGQDGIKMDPKKIEVIQKYPRPTTVKEIQSFLGGAGYYRRFIKNFSKHSAPMNKLTQKNQPYIWGNEQQKSFEKIKQKLITSPVLIYPDLEKPFRLYTDASNIALGAVLQQKGEDGKEHPVAFISKKLTKQQQKYHSTELECFAAKWAVKKFHHYLAGNKFTIISDYKNMKWWFNNYRDTNARRIRWKMFMQPYYFNIEYKKGVENKVADALSRIRDE
jgi:hypothetical protein